MDGSRAVQFGLGNVLHELFELAPPNEIVLSKEGGLFRSDHVIANFLLPWFQSERSGLTQALIIPGCQIPKQIYRDAFHHEPSPMGKPRFPSPSEAAR